MAILPDHALNCLNRADYDNIQAVSISLSGLWKGIGLDIVLVEPKRIAKVAGGMCFWEVKLRKINNELIDEQTLTECHVITRRFLPMAGTFYSIGRGHGADDSYIYIIYKVLYCACPPGFIDTASEHPMSILFMNTDDLKELNVEIHCPFDLMVCHTDSDGDITLIEKVHVPAKTDCNFNNVQRKLEK